MRLPVWLRYLLATVAAAVAYFAVPPSGFWALVLYNAVGTSAVAAILLGVRRNRPARPRPWYLFAAGQLSFVVADVLFYVQQNVLHVRSPFPSVADAFYLGMYPLVVAGLVLLLRDLAPGRDRASLTDAGIIATSGFVLVWVLFMDSYLVEPGLGALERVISVAYPAMDVMLLGVGARLVAGVRLRSPSFFLLGASVAGLLVADTAYGVTELAGAYETGAGIDALWLLFYALFGAAALHPSMARLSRPVAPALPQFTLRRLVVPSLATLTVPVVDLLFARDQFGDEAVTAVGSMTLFVLALAHVASLVRAIEAGQERLRHEALHDSLTGLANRALFADRLDAALAHKEQEDGLVAVLFIDLDDFKTVNDSLGHQAGDELLVEVARRLRRCVRAGDTVARLGGDEFAVLLEDSVGAQRAVQVAERLLAALAEPVELSVREVTARSSVGIAAHARRQGQAEVLLRSADVAMYLAKTRGKGGYAVFEESMYDEVVERLELKTDLQSALELDQLELHYQPILALGGKAVAGVEALLRWHHPTRGVVAPDIFVPLAEETGLIVPIGRWVLDQACQQAKRWQEEHPENPPLMMSVNVSVRQLHDQRLVRDVACALEESGLDPDHLTLEVTESVLMQDREFGARRLRELKALGIRLAIDDFGTGYSSLSYLQSFPVDSIKIDRSFVQRLGRSGGGSALVRSLIDLAEALSLSTVAEGIEDLDQLSALTDLHCDLGQGFYFSKPLTSAAMGVLLGKPGILGAAPPARPSRPRFPEVTLPPLLAATASVEVHEGPDVLDRLGKDLDELLGGVRGPVIARAQLARWLRANPDCRPLVVVVRNRHRGALDAVALLAQRRLGDGLELVGMGPGRLGATCLPARNAMAAAALAGALGQLLSAEDGRWSLELGQLPGDDPVAALVAERLAHAHLLPGPRVPRVGLLAGQGVSSHLGRGMRRQLRQARNRLASAGVRPEICFERRSEAVAALLRQAEALSHRPDGDEPTAGGQGHQQEPEHWFRAGCLAEDATEDLEVGVARFDGQLAAYLVAVVDGHSYRVLAGGFDPGFSRFSPGRLVQAAALERALSDETIDEVVWEGAGEEETAVGRPLAESSRLATARLSASSEARDDCPACSTLSPFASLLASAGD